MHRARVNSQDRGRSQVDTFRQNTQAESRQTRRLNSRDKLQQLCFTTSVLTTMKSPHFFFFLRSDLLTCRRSAQAPRTISSRSIVRLWYLARFPQSGTRVVVCLVLGSAPSVARVFLRVCKSKAATLCHHKACAASLESRCFVCYARFGRLTNVLKPYVSAGEHDDIDKASAPVCSMTLDIWPSIRENKEDVVS